MDYVKVDGQTVVKWPYTLADLKADHPNDLFGRVPPESAFTDRGAFPVIVDEPPSPTDTAVPAKDDLPEYRDGAWRLGWHLEPLDEARVKSRLAAEWQRRVDLGGVFTVPGVTDPIPVPGKQPYREIIQAKLSAAQLFASQGVTEPAVLFRDGANTNHMLTPTQMINLCLQSMRFYEALSRVFWDMKDGAGDFTGGIPENFTADEHWP